MDNKKIKVGIAGIGGRMGSRIAQLVNEAEGMELSGGLETASSPRIGKDVSEIIGGAPTGTLISSSIEDVFGKSDVIIDFTNADSSIAHLQAAAKAKKAIVIGSTGFFSEQVSQVRELAKNIPVVLAPNMSLGINVLIKILADTAKLLGDGYDVEIVEAHHRFKKDAPSGTALRLAEAVASALNRDLKEVGVYERHGLVGERKEKEIGIQTVRAGDIIGDHTVMFGGMGERIEITHRAHSRDTFVRGAIKAAEWVIGKEPGLYDMQNVLGIKP